MLVCRTKYCRFESCGSYCSLGVSVNILPFQGKEMGSIPIRSTNMREWASGQFKGSDCKLGQGRILLITDFHFKSYLNFIDLIGVDKTS